MVIKNDGVAADKPVAYHIGDTIVHWSYGLGTIVAMDTKEIAGVPQNYYVVEVESLQLWVPIEEANASSIRFPTESIHFKALFDILKTPGEQLPEQHYQRRIHLQERMQKKTLADLCHLIRDLADYAGQHTLNQNDSAILSRAEKHLLDEWVLSLGVKRSTAFGELEILLRGGQAVVEG